MSKRPERGEVVIQASVAKHLALAPVAFAVTEGPTHKVIYANDLFRRLQSADRIHIGARAAKAPSTASDLTPLLDQVYRGEETLRDVVLEHPAQKSARWSCSIWPIPGTPDNQHTLVIEVRDVQLIEGAKARQRAIAERLLLGALREQDVAGAAVRASERAQHLAQTSRELATSLDESATREAVSRIALPRPGSWCIVDVVESNGAMHRLAVVHPDPAKQDLARTLEHHWLGTATGDGRDKAGTRATVPAAASTVLRTREPKVVTGQSEAALLLAAHGPVNLDILRRIGFGSLLVVPLVVRARVQGALTFVSREGDPPFTAEETALAVDLAMRCALALDNARLYREADALRLAAELANQSKSQFLRGMSHELRTPLNAIGGFAELIEMGVEGPVTEQQQVALARIKANQQHLLALITEILDFVRVEAGRMEYRSAEVSVSQALRYVGDMLGSVIAKKRLSIESVPAASDVLAWADPDRVRQILVNLVMNAVKYTPSGGRITLRCEQVGDQVLAIVRDTGAGILPEAMESIFEPFVQLTAGLAERSGGVGLGLAISRDLARAMQGDLTVESTVGVGSTFTLTLPRA